MVTNKFVVIHTISDPEGFYSAVEQAIINGLPIGISQPIQARTLDYRKAVVFWEGPSLEDVKSLVESVVGAYSTNEFFEMEVEEAKE